MSDACFHCGKPSTKLCDFHIGMKIHGYVRDGSVPANRWMAVGGVKEGFHTCDRPLCNDCSTVVGRIIACGKAGFTDTFDRCRDHKDQDDVHAPLLTDEEARKIRRLLHLRLTAPRGLLQPVKSEYQ